MSSANLIPNLTNPSPSIYFHGPYRPQNFPLPDSIIYYISKNPSSPKFHQKIIRTCKYFFTKNPVIIFGCLHFTIDGWKTCFKKCEFDENDYKKFDIEKFAGKLWITDVLDLRNNYTITPPSFISKLFRCNVNTCLLFQQNLTFDELKFLVSSATICHLRKCDIIDRNGNFVKNETILANFPKIKEQHFVGVEPRPYLCQECGVRHKSFSSLRDHQIVHKYPKIQTKD